MAVTIPVLPSLNLAETEAFYGMWLGFVPELYDEEKYLIVRRDGMEMHFWFADDRRLPENTSCYIRGGQIERLYEEYRRTNVPGLHPMSVRPWGMKEFYIHDPHGNLLRFGMSDDEAS